MIYCLLGVILYINKFCYNKCNLLYLDVLIIDEVLMVDLLFMVKFIEVLLSYVRFILLGDKD